MSSHIDSLIHPSLVNKFYKRIVGDTSNPTYASNYPHLILIISCLLYFILFTDIFNPLGRWDYSINLKINWALKLENLKLNLNLQVTINNSTNKFSP